jgi:beta-lactamase regulating signal transducer with metallopeptidase domain
MVFLVTLIKWSLLFCLGSILLYVFKKLTPGNRHVLWLLLIFGLVLIPILSGFIQYPWFETSKSLSQKSEAAKRFNDIFFLQPLNQEAHSIKVTTGAVSIQSSHYTTATGPNWALSILLCWVAGIVVSSFRAIIGRFRLSALHEDTHTPVMNECRMQKDILSNEMSLKKEVHLTTTSKCTIPFTYRIFKPVVVLPRESAAWPSGRLRAVLLHELAHIRRHDYLTQSVARIICSLFWFIPFVWIVYSKLYQEQERACDVFVMERGIGPAEYASHILSLACISSMRTVSFQGSFLSKGRKKFLERRILHTLSFQKAANASKGGKKMTYRNFLLLCGILLVAFALIGSCATRRKAISEEEFFEAYSGTWINTEYSGEDSFYTQKVVLHPDGTRMEYALVTLDTCSWYGKDTITDMWKDPSGVIWYKASWENPAYNAKGYMMGKISGSGNTLEVLSCMWGEPIEKWDTDNIHYHYSIYYRQ